jgi:Ca2+-binding RTX toxin-like protein
MPINTAITYLVYADLQMAAEAILDNFTFTSPQGLREALEFGNNRSSKFTPTQAAQFVQDWKVVAHQANTSTGFSGTVFECLQDDPARGLVRGQLVMCFRSTEFADDAARDNQATNVMEVKEYGWAFGQIADMKQWFDGLNAPGGALAGKTFAVTGYSLGANLAAGFNQLLAEQGQGSRISATYTFNGAGVGEITSGSLSQTITQFQSQRNAGQQSFFTTTVARDYYGRWSAELNGSADTTRRGQALGELTNLQVTLSANPTANATALRELDLLSQAVSRGNRVRIEAERINAGVSSGNTSAAAGRVDATTASIAAIGLDYQLAVLRASANTRAFSSGILDGLGLAIAADRAPQTLAGASPIYDLFAAPLPSAVSNSQHHYGTPVPVFIEDQPLTRGNFIGTTVAGSLRFGEVKLLNGGFAVNDFGDTHSLVLIADSLSVQSALARLDTNVQQSTLDTALRNASNTRGSSLLFTQGTAEFDTLERMVQALGDITGASSDAAWRRMNPNPSGGTWAVREDEGSYSGRDTFHANLRLINLSPAFTGMAGQMRVVATHEAQAAHDDFAALLSLVAGASFSLRLNDLSANSPALIKLGDANRVAYDQWLADRTTINAGGDRSALNFTDEYLTDRTTLVSTLARRNGGDSNSNLVTTTSAPNDRVLDFAYADALNGQTGTLVLINSAVVNRDLSGRHQLVAFGNEQANTLNGTSNTLGDHLYGGGGNDTVNGLGGADWLEGNAGNDQLDGGTGNDTLRGGQGNDRYTFASGSGFDEIIDSDGTGTITVTGIGPIDGSNTVKVGEGVWQTPDARVNYTQVPVTGGHDLYISFSDRTDVIVIRNWSPERSVGITLGGAATPPAAVVLSEGADNVHLVSGAPSSDYDYIGVPVAYDARVIQGLGGNDEIRALRSEPDGVEPIDNILSGGQGNDFVFGGTGNDFLAGNEGNNVIYGGAGNDIVVSWVYAAGVERVNAAAPPLGRRAEWSEVGQYWSWGYEEGWNTPGRHFNYVTFSDGSPGPLSTYWKLTQPNPDYVMVVGNFPGNQDGKDIIFGGEGDDLIAAGDDNDIVSGDAGQDAISGGSGDDILSGGDDDDEVLGGLGNDALDGEGGNDVLMGGPGAYTMLGGSPSTSAAANDNAWRVRA